MLSRTHCKEVRQRAEKERSLVAVGKDKATRPAVHCIFSKCYSLRRQRQCQAERATLTLLAGTTLPLCPYRNRLTSDQDQSRAMQQYSPWPRRLPFLMTSISSGPALPSCSHGCHFVAGCSERSAFMTAPTWAPAAPHHTVGYAGSPTGAFYCFCVAVT